MFFGIIFQVFYSKEITKMSAVMPIEKEGVSDFFIFVNSSHVSIDFINSYCMFCQPSLRSSQLYSKLFEEAEKIKAWKLKMDYDILQKDRNLQENKRTIETQRKAIQELQVNMAMIRQIAKI